MSTQGELAISKRLVSENEIGPGDQAIFKLTIENTGAEEVLVDVFDSINVITTAEFAWSGISLNASVAVTGSAGGGIDVIDEELTVPRGGKFEYTIIATAKDPFRGTITNCARYCTAEMEFADYVASETVYVGMLEGDACLDHGGHDLNTALYEFLPQRERAAKFFDYIESGYDLLHIIEAVDKLITGNDSTAKPFNPDYVGITEDAEAAAALEAAEAAAEAAMQQAIDDAEEAAADNAVV